MWLITAIGIIFNTIPIIRRLYRWIWEHHMELELREPHSQIVRGRNGLNIPDGTAPIFTIDIKKRPNFYMWCDLVITNHHKDTPAVITNCELHLKIRHWLLWEKTIASAQVLVEPTVAIPERNRTVWKPIKLEPMSLPTIISVASQGDIPYPPKKLLGKMRLVLEFDMVGLHRHIKKPVCNIIDGRIYRC